MIYYKFNHYILKETYAARERKREASSMVQMEPQGHIGPADNGQGGYI